MTAARDRLLSGEQELALGLGLGGEVELDVYATPAFASYDE